MIFNHRIRLKTFYTPYNVIVYNSASVLQENFCFLPTKEERNDFTGGEML